MRPPLLIVLIAILSLNAQQRNLKAPPVFDPSDTEGLNVSPNPGIRHAWKRKVFWRISNQPSRGTFGKIPPQTPAERQQMAQTLDRLTAVFKATPTGSLGQGFWINESRTLDYFDPFALPTGLPVAKIPLQFESGLYPFYHEDIFEQGKWKLSVNGETDSVYYSFNRLPGPLRQTIIASEARSGDLSPIDFYLPPKLTGSIAGLNIFDGNALLITRGGRSPWAPAPLGRVLKAALPLFEKDRKTAEDRLAGLKAKNVEVQAPAYEQAMRDRFEKNNGSLRTTRPSNYQARLRSMEHELQYNRQRAAEEANPERQSPKGAWYWNPLDAFEEASRKLASLTPEQAAKPACFAPVEGIAKEGRYSIRGKIDAVGSSPQCTEIVQTNWSYFDLSLPRSAPQILMVHDFGRCARVEQDRIVSAPVNRFDAPPQGCVQHAQMWREVDWSKLAALVR